MENTSFYVNIGNVIREMRKRKSLTQDALAQAVGVSVQAVSKWETGQSLPDITLLPAIADFFEISIDTLFERKTPTSETETPATGAKGDSPAAFPDDDKLRVVQFMGNRLMSCEECVDNKNIRLALDQFAGTLSVEIHGSARINGPVNGATRAAGDIYASGSINGEATAGGNIYCEGRVNGSVHAASDVSNGDRQNADSGRDAVAHGINGMVSNILDNVSSMLGNLRTKNTTASRMNAFFSGQLPDDDKLRVIQMQGRKILSVEESADSQIIRMSVEHFSAPLNVEIYGSAEIHGPVNGNASAGDSLSCHAVAGNVSAGDAVSCGPVGGDVTAGDSVDVTGDVKGDASAGDSVVCGNVMGNVMNADSLHRSVRCQAFDEDRKSENRNDNTPDFSFCSFKKDTLNVVQVMNGQILSCEESRGNKAVRLALDDATDVRIEVHGDAVIDGEVDGNVSASGSVNCGEVEGDVFAGSGVNCGDVDGNVSAGGNVNCADVDADVSASGSVNCGDVGGDVRIDGKSGDPTLVCGSIEGHLFAKGAHVRCGDVLGDVSVENASVQYDSVGGDFKVNRSNVSKNE